MKIDLVRKFALSLEAVTEESHHHWGGKVVGLRVSLKAAKASMVKSLVLDADNTRVSKDAGVKTKKLNTKSE
jgi:hypothetical protein